ncbi:integrase catalytic domain-containing protein, partial [Trichonephila clavata]
RPGNQEIAPLPPDRVLEPPPFSISGLDFASPFFIKDSDKKHYLLLFTCATTRALHLELLPSMSTEQFLLAFRRFISRRGLCSTIYSDNAKTFKRAELELKKFWRCMLHPSVQDLFSTHVTRVSREDLTGSRPSLLKRYRHQQNLLNQFWNRWRKHYLLSLRSMNICPPSKVTCQFKVDDVLLIHDDRFPRNLWSMGKIIETYTGRDGKIRSCLVKTKNNAIRRPVQLLYNLEV